MSFAIFYYELHCSHVQSSVSLGKKIFKFSFDLSFYICNHKMSININDPSVALFHEIRYCWMEFARNHIAIHIALRKIFHSNVMKIIVKRPQNAMLKNWEEKNNNLSLRCLISLSCCVSCQIKPSKNKKKYCAGS
jgi:hypothetical protein